MKYAIASVIVIAIVIAISLSTRARGQALPTTAPSRIATSRPSTRPGQNPAAPTGRANRRNNQRGGRRTRAATGASTAPSPYDTTPAPGQMSDEFDLLNTRSMFVPGRIRTPGQGGGDSRPGNAPEDVTVFSGVTITDYQIVAFIEDTSTNKVSQVQIGQQIGQGKITDITLDGLEYQSDDGRRIHVNVGQNMRGANAWEQVYGIDSGGAVPAAADEPTDPSTAAIIAKLKQKRAAELAGSGAVAPTTAPSPAPAR